jgi:hypothetical protein
MASTALRAYTAGTALLCTGAIAFSLHQQAAAEQWQKEAGAWQSVSRQSVAKGRKAIRSEHRLAIRYNALVRHTNRSQQVLLKRLKSASSQPAATVYRTSAGAVSSAPVATVSTAPVSVPAPAPTTHVS